MVRSLSTLSLLAAGAVVVLPSTGSSAKAPRDRVLPLSLESTIPLPFGHPLDLAAAPGLLCAANGAGGLLVYDAADPVRPKLLSRYLSPALPSALPNGGDGRFGATALAISGRLCFLLWSSPQGSRIELLSLAEPARPKLMGALTLPQPVTALRALSDSRVMATTIAAAEAGKAARPSLLLADFEDPAHPALLSHWELPPGEGDHLDRLAYAAETALVCGNDDGSAIVNGSLQVLTYAEPSRPELLSATRTRGPALDVAITKAGVVAYVACGTSGVNYFDLSDRAAPRFLGSLDTHGVAALRVVLSGSRLYVLTPGEILRYDVSTPLRPRRVPSSPNGLGGTVLAAGDGFVAAAARERGIDLRRTDADGAPQDGTTIGCVGDPAGLRVAGDHALVALGGGGLLSIDYARPKAPHADGDFTILPSGGHASRVLDAVPVGDRNLWLTVSPGGLVVSPSRGSFSTRLGLTPADPALVQLANRGGQVIGLSSDGSLRTYDATDAHWPVPLGHLDLKLPVGTRPAFALRNMKAVVAAGPALIECDVADAAAPKELLRWSPGATADFRDLAFEGGSLYAVDGAGGFCALDFPAAGPPTLVSRSGEAGGTHLAIQQGLACVSGGGAGLAAFDVSRPAEMEPLALRTPDLVGALNVAWLPAAGKDRFLLIAGPGWLRCYRTRFQPR